jgi:hypothetical protein
MCLRTGTVTAALVDHLVGFGQRLRAAAQSGEITLLARGASDESDTAVALPLIAVSSQNVIGSFEARFFCAEVQSVSSAHEGRRNAGKFIRPPAGTRSP